MIVIGVDVHKRTHALAAVDGITGREIAPRAIQATDGGHVEALRFAAGLGGQVVWAIEDCRHVSRRLEQALLGVGSQVIRVPPATTGQARKGQRRPGKSDPIDALAVARTVVREGVERFAVAFLDERAMEIRVLQDHREQLMTERTRAINRLRSHLLVLNPALEADLGPRTLHYPAPPSPDPPSARKAPADSPSEGRIKRAVPHRCADQRDQRPARRTGPVDDRPQPGAPRRGRRSTSPDHQHPSHWQRSRTDAMHRLATIFSTDFEGGALRAPPGRSCGRSLRSRPRPGRRHWNATRERQGLANRPRHGVLPGSASIHAGGRHPQKRDLIARATTAAPQSTL